MHIMCSGPIEFVEPDLAGLLPISPPPDSGDKRESGGVGVTNERAKKDGGGDSTQAHTHTHTPLAMRLCICSAAWQLVAVEENYLHEMCRLLLTVETALVCQLWKLLVEFNCICEVFFISQ